jgi:ribosomal 50S subunit-associated protein YjgA (DUF615 family)
MNNIKRFTFILATLLLFSGIAMMAPVSAHDGSSGSGNDSSETEVENEANDLTEQFRQKGKDKIHELRMSGQERSQAARQKSCEARKANLTKRMNRAVLQAEKHKAVFDKIYTRVKDFYVNKQLNVTDYDTLTAAVDEAQTNAQASVDSLKTLDVSVDCASQNVAEGVGAFREAVKTTRDSLKDYRKSLVDLINSLKGASTGNHDSTSGEDSGDTTDTTNQTETTQ